MKKRLVAFSTVAALAGCTAESAPQTVDNAPSISSPSSSTYEMTPSDKSVEALGQAVLKLKNNPPADAKSEQKSRENNGLSYKFTEIKGALGATGATWTVEIGDTFSDGGPIIGSLQVTTSGNQRETKQSIHFSGNASYPGHTTQEEYSVFPPHAGTDKTSVTILASQPGPHEVPPSIKSVESRVGDSGVLRCQIPYEGNHFDHVVEGITAVVQSINNQTSLPEIKAPDAPFAAPGSSLAQQYPICAG